MKKYMHNLIKSAQVASLSVFLITAGLHAQDTLAGGNTTGQPSGTTLAGSSTTPPPAVSALTAILLGGSGPGMTSTTTTTSGVTTTTTTVTVPASSLYASLMAVGLSLPDYGSTTEYTGSSGTFTVTNKGETVTITYVTTP